MKAEQLDTIFPWVNIAPFGCPESEHTNTAPVLDADGNILHLSLCVRVTCRSAGEADHCHVVGSWRLKGRRWRWSNDAKQNTHQLSFKILTVETLCKGSAFTYEWLLMVGLPDNLNRGRLLYSYCRRNKVIAEKRNAFEKVRRNEHKTGWQKMKTPNSR